MTQTATLEIMEALGLGDARAGGKTERAVAALCAGAIGDAFGYEIKFDGFDVICDRFGGRGLVEPVRHDGKLIVSDDTQMTLFTLEGLVRSRTRHSERDVVVEAIREAYLDWYATQRGDRRKAGYHGQLGAQPMMWRLRAPGGTCLSALDAGGHGAPDRPANHSKGCGGVMRVAPIGLMPGLGDAARRFDLAQRAAALTHGHPGGYRPAGAMAFLLFRLVHGAKLDQAISDTVTCLGPHVEGDDTARLTAEAVRLAALNKDDARDHVTRLGQGWVGDEAFAIAVFAALAGRSFPETLQIAANHDGDSDSTASLAGQIWAAQHGFDGVSKDRILDLDLWPVMTVLLCYLAWPDEAVR